MSNNGLHFNGVYEAQQRYIAKCQNEYQLNFLRDCIERTVEAGFDEQKAGQLYALLEQRKQECLSKPAHNQT
jgi:hypothetical protein